MSQGRPSDPGNGGDQSNRPESLTELTERIRQRNEGRAPLQSIQTPIPYGEFSLDPDTPGGLALGRIVHRAWSTTFGWNGNEQRPIRSGGADQLTVSDPDFARAEFETFDGINVGNTTTLSDLPFAHYWEIYADDDWVEATFSDSNGNQVGRLVSTPYAVNDGNAIRWLSVLKAWITASQVTPSLVQGASGQYFVNAYRFV